MGRDPKALAAGAGDSRSQVAACPNKPDTARARNIFTIYVAPINERFQVGLIRISFTQTCGGMFATNEIVRPRSAGCNILAIISSLGGTGLLFRIGVATSAGDRQHARSPFSNSSMLKEWVSAR